MKSIFHVIFALLLLLQAFSAPLHLGNSQAHLAVASSKQGNNVELMVTIKAKEGTQIKLFSEALSPSTGTHSLIMGQARVEVDPPMDEETLIWNSYHDNAYYLAFDHNFDESFHFIPLEMTVGDKTTELILPTFNHPMFMMPESSFYSCQKTLISIQTEQQGVHVSLFSDSKEQSWRLDGKWKMKWREIDNLITFGYGLREQKNEKITVLISDQYACEFYPQALKESEDILDPKKYYTLENLLAWAPKLPVTKIQKYENEEL